MKTTLKFRFFLLTIISCILFNTNARADDDRPITVDKLPKKAQEFIIKHFPHNQIAVAKQEGMLIEKNYDIIFTNGDKVEFDRNGEWTNVSCKYSRVPDAIIPPQITSYIQRHYPNVKVNGIEKDKWYYEVNLVNDIELKFNHSFKLIDADF